MCVYVIEQFRFLDEWVFRIYKNNKIVARVQYHFQGVACNKLNH